jgi:hypothetical protein
MTVDEFIAAAEEKIATTDSIKEFSARTKERGEKFEREAKKRMVDEDFLARSYNH